MELVLVRLPPSVPAAVRAVRRSLRGGQGRRTRRARAGRRRRRSIAVSTDRGVLRAPLVVDALGWRRVLGRRRPPAPAGATLARRWRCIRTAEGRISTCGSSAVARPPRLRLARAGRRRGARRRRAPTTRPTTCGARPRRSPSAWRSTRALPGQLVSPPSAPGRRGRRVLRRRLRRTLLRAVGRGDPAPPSTSASPAGASCAGCWPGSATASTALAALRRVQRTPSAGCSARPAPASG